MPPKKQRPRRKFTDKELAQIEGWSAVRLPLEEIAILLKCDKDWFLQLAKKDGAVRAALDEGRAKSKGNVRQTLYQMAVGRTGGTTSDGKVVPPQAPDFKALRFWCQTQEDFKTTDRLEILNRDDLSEMNDAQLEEEEARLNGILANRKRLAPAEE